MARAAKFSEDDILDAASAAIADAGRGATIAQVAKAAGAPVGSIYHRYPSREDLFVSLWLRSIRRFHVGLLEAMAAPDPNEAAIAAAVHIPRFCREHPRDALAMTMYRQADLVASAPSGLVEEVRHVNDRVDDATRDVAARRYPEVDDFRLALLATACRESPYGLVRRYLGSSVPIPPWLDDAVRASTAAMLALGDR
ncbi:TetR/AcrR family transcriptional regulator [Tsukamurella sp. PLM1]|uniref:TetR/AcrR family transcriptional regulator n=1 Tax=Tsukamurella sp. PLM1 TaxID=2929795 RepID=UPI00206E9A01|nr:TetR/AcrR family transcriptional regulator [Tsukamurella sp. PLM1]BDH55203.1 putative transcriptional regulator, TetR family protein [Tsukamurella sp. PLM1]